MTNEQLNAVLKVLTEQGGYRMQPRLVSVDDVAFEFDAILRGPGNSEAMVVIMYADDDRIPLATSRIRALSHTMLRSGSTRPLTLVVLLANQDTTVLRELLTICRIVPVTTANEQDIVAALRSLLPLALPEPATTQLDANRMLRAALGELASDNFVASLISAGKKSSKAVEEMFANSIEATIAEHLSEDSGNAQTH